MKFLGKKKKVKPLSEKSEKEPNALEQLCGDDKLLYQELSTSLYLKPKGQGTYLDGMEKAEALERERKKDDSARAYHHAGRLALYEGNVEGVRKAFDKLAELSGSTFPRIREVPEKAVIIAREFYAKELVV